jgi:hypothetical protein
MLQLNIAFSFMYFYYNNLAQMVPKYAHFLNTVWWEKISPLHANYVLEKTKKNKKIPVRLAGTS